MIKKFSHRRWYIYHQSQLNEMFDFLVFYCIGDFFAIENCDLNEAFKIVTINQLQRMKWCMLEFIFFRLCARDVKLYLTQDLRIKRRQRSFEPATINSKQQKCLIEARKNNQMILQKVVETTLGSKWELITTQFELRKQSENMSVKMIWQKK